MILYLDTSAFIKLYMGEPRAEIVRPAHMLRRAGDLAERFRLRGYDSVHLAAAESLLIGHGGSFLSFASFDHALNAAASAVGLRLLAAD